jgi:ribonuclease T1
MRLAALATGCAAIFLAFASPEGLAQRAPAPSTAEVPVGQLPKEARDTIALVRKGGPYPYAKDGVVFGNREGRLPAQKRGYYREFTVKTPGERTRGARRIIAGKQGDFWYTDDHYATFRRVRD